jgi:hypothetical protein
VIGFIFLGFPFWDQWIVARHGPTGARGLSDDRECDRLAFWSFGPPQENEVIMQEDDRGTGRALAARYALPILLVVAVVILGIAYRQEISISGHLRTFVVLALAAFALYGGNRAMFPPGRSSGDPDSVRYVVAFDSVIFLIVGLAAAMIVCRDWEIPLLLGGACALIGGFFGLLFGYPQGVASQSPTPAADGGAAPNTRDKNLVAESAATMGKLIAGFTLAKLGGVFTHFSNLCVALAPALTDGHSDYGYVLAGVIVAYFLATGFLSGLLLPSYFMRGVI